MKTVASEIFLFIFSFIMLIQMGMWKIVGTNNGISPEAWPKAILYGIVALSLYQLFVKKIRKTRETVCFQNFNSRVIIVMALMGLYIIGMLYLGFLVATLLFQWLMLLTIGFRKKFLFILSPVAITSLLYIIFIWIMYVPLPRGVGAFRVLSYFFY